MRRTFRTLVAVIAASIALAPAAASAAPEGRAVQLPHPLQDALGNTWMVNADGSISDPTGRLYDGGGHLMFGDVNNGEGYANNNNTATYDEKSNEVVLPPMPHNGLNVSRRVAVNAKGGWCRFVEVFENPTKAPVRVRAQTGFSFNQGIQVSQVLEDPADPNGKAAAGPRAIAVFDGQSAVAMIAAGRGGRVRPTLSARVENSQAELAFELEVPARQTMAVLHVQVRRRTIDEASEAFRKLRDREFTADLPASLRSRLANFAKPGLTIGDDIDLLRGDALDVVELRNGDQYKGTLQSASYKLETNFGPIELPAAQVLSVLAVGQHRPTTLFVTVAGEVFGGTPAADAIQIELSNGHVATLPVSAVARVGYRRRPGEPEEWKFDKPMATLAAGDRLAVELPTAPIPFITPLGALTLDPASVASVALASDGGERTAHEVRLRDGSRLTGLVAAERLEFKPATVGGGRTIAINTADLAHLQLAAEDAPEPRDDDPVLALANGDRLVGALAGKLVLETAFDVITVDAGEVMALHRGGADGATAAGRAGVADVHVTLWDGGAVSGRLRGGAVSCAPKSGGSAVRVPSVMLARYDQPLPTPPMQAAERIRQTIAELSSDDPVRREAAAAQLSALGKGVRGVLRAVRDLQPPKGQAQIDAIVKSFESAPPLPPATGEVNPPPIQGDDLVIEQEDAADEK